MKGNRATEDFGKKEHPEERSFFHELH